MGHATSRLSRAKLEILDLLKRAGPATASEVAEVLGTTVVAVRQHLAALEGVGLVRSDRRPPAGRGRPSVQWALTAESASLFPDEHAELAVGLIEAIREATGERGLEKVVRARARRQAEEYRRLLPGGAAPLASRVEALARQRTAEGYMAEVTREGPGVYVLTERHCPICDAARACRGLCRAELQVFRECLGPGVEVERTVHLLTEGDRCAYRIRRARGGEGAR